MMTKEEAAARLDGNEYGSEGSKDLWVEMRDSRLVALFGYSDDVIEIRGVEHDEVGAGGTIYFNDAGILKNECEEGDDCPYFEQIARHAYTVDVGDGQDGGMFRYQTTIPHATFKIMEDGEYYSAGIVFSLDDLDEAP